MGLNRPHKQRDTNTAPMMTQACVLHTNTEFARVAHWKGISMARITAIHPALVAFVVACAGSLSVQGCRTVADVCRFEPDRCPSGEPGAECIDDRDCFGFCCTDGSNCRGGMCTYACQNNEDCPRDMACEHDMCFFACEFDEDCAVGQSCEHGNTVCEWP